jgi:hypothetical protein
MLGLDREFDGNANSPHRVQHQEIETAIGQAPAECLRRKNVGHAQLGIDDIMTSVILLTANNAGSARVLSRRLIVVNAATDPIKVLRLLMKGLVPDERDGICLINFQGVPIARAAAAFDVIYLDERHRVLRAIEIEPGREYAPFRGQPASALILPPKTIARSKTFTGDEIAFHALEEPVIELETASSSQRTEESWLDLRQETAPVSEPPLASAMRRAPRIRVPYLVGYYGSGPRVPHEIKNMSVLGFYMVMDEVDRLWTPGTVIRVTLQTLESDRTKSYDSITVSSRIVFWGPDGGGFEFVFSA